MKKEYFKTCKILLYCAILTQVYWLASGAEQYNLDFSTYWGGSVWEHARDVFIDGQGNVYVCGGTASPDFPTTAGAYSRTLHTGGVDSPQVCDGFVSKFGPTGNLIWSTYLGGPNYDRAYALEVDNQGYVYVCGRGGVGFPTTAGAFQPNFNGSNNPASGYAGKQNGWIAKLSPDGSQLVWASYVGITQLCRDIAIDPDGGYIYVPMGYIPGDGTTALPAAWFATAYQKTFKGGGCDSGVIKIKGDGTQVAWATYLGGTGDDYEELSIRVDAGGYVYVAGQTTSIDFPTTAGTRRTKAGGFDLFAAKISPDGSSLVYSTYLGGSADEYLSTHNLAIDSQGNAYISDGTASPDFPTTTGAFQRSFGGGTDLFVTKLSPTGVLLASTYLGSNGPSGANEDGTYVDASGNVFISGETSATNLPVTAGCYQSSSGGGVDGFFAKLSSDLSQLMYCSYMGTSSPDHIRSGCYDSNGHICVVGQIDSPGSGWPVKNAYQNSYGGGLFDAFVAKFSLVTITPTITVQTPNGGESWTQGTTQTVVWTSSNLTGNVNIEITTNGGTNWTSLAGNTANDGTQAVTMPSTPSTTCRVRVSGTSGTPTDNSDNNFTIALPPAPTITVQSPNGGESWQTGTNQTITWTSANLTGNVNIEITTNGGTNWTSLAGNTANDGTQAVTMPSLPSTTCKVRVQSAAGTPTDNSDSNFTLFTPAPAITVTSPNGGETWQTNTVQTVTWTSSNLTGNVDIEISFNGISGPWTALRTATANDNAEAITAPTTSGTACRIRVKEVSGTTFDYSDNNFTINGNVPIPIVSVNTIALDFGGVVQGQAGTNTFNITNNGSGTLTGTLTKSQPWITVAPESFNGNSAVITVTVNTTGLSTGPNTGTIAVATNGGNATVNVSVNVTPQAQDPQINVSSTKLSFGELEVGSVSKPQALMITNSGGGSLTGTIATVDSWIKIDKTSFVIAGGVGQSLNVTADNSILSQKEGPAKGEITIISNGNNGSQVTTTISVEFTATCVLVKPNPVRLSSPLAGEGKGEGSITFFGDGIVPGQTTIRIYTLDGELIKTIESLSANPVDGEGRGEGDITWSGRTDNGKTITPGIYIYIYESPKEKGVGKITVIK